MILIYKDVMQWWEAVRLCLSLTVGGVRVVAAGGVFPPLHLTLHLSAKKGWITIRLWKDGRNACWKLSVKVCWQKCVWTGRPAVFSASQTGEETLRRLLADLCDHKTGLFPFMLVSSCRLSAQSTVYKRPKTPFADAACTPHRGDLGE